MASNLENEDDYEGATEATDKVLDDDELFEELEKGEDLEESYLREQRIRQLRGEMERIRTMKENAHGTYRVIDQEKELMQITTNTKLCVVHFFHKEFRRCQIMDSHLEKLARKHFKTRFMKIDVENAPFLVDKLKVKVLPTVICFVDSVSVDRIIGFDELGGTDSFSTSNLEKRLLKAKVILLSDAEEDDDY